MSGDAERSYRLTVHALAGLALVLLAYPLARIFWDYEIDNTEGWNAYLQLRAAAGLPLYDTGSPYFFNNYPPLSFYLVGALSHLTGDVNMAGRLASFASVIALCLAVRSIVRSAGGSRLDGWFGAVTCALFFAALVTDYVGKNNPQLLGQALVLWGLAVHLGGTAGARRAALAALLFSAGVLVKHNLICLPLLVGLDVLLRGPARARLGFFLTGLALAGLSGGLLWLSSNGAFFTQLLASRTWEVSRSFLFTVEILGQFQAPMALVGIGLIAARSTRPAGLILAYLGAALAFGIFFSGGAGTDVNVFFDVYVALAAGAGLVLRLAPFPRARPAMALLVNAGVLFYAPLSLGRIGVDLAGEAQDHMALFRDEVAYVRSIPGTALCQSHLLCLRAGKPAFYDPINMLQAMTMGRLPADTLTGMLRRHEIAVVQILDPPRHPEDANPGAQEMPARWKDFQDEVFQVLREEYVIDRVSLSGRFYRPKGDTSPR
ncbi:glycosyltransferase 87 family protein [Paramagnetospirillum caucaseum]|uniref:glycosyltransferase 87 family protein n=1 Tax=Paramagnetospirillum caucaseum TaxID=1244869 RepID=UPI00058FC247|nr:glycosyltransferase 87 family protein [Paramagnetospirillum caucaseum]